MIEGLSKMIKLSSKMKTVFPKPNKVRTYQDIKDNPYYFSDPDKPAFVLPTMEKIDHETDMILLDDIEKECVMGLMEYYEYLDKFTGEFVDNQEFIMKCNHLLQQVLEDRPVKQEVLLEMCPELYVYRIMSNENNGLLGEMYKNLGLKPEQKAKVLELEKKEQNTLVPLQQLESVTIKLTPPPGPKQDDYKLRVGNFQVWDPEDLKVQEIYRNPHYSPYEIYRRVTYIWNEIQKTYIDSSETISKLEEKMGSVNAVLQYLKIKGDACNEEEKNIVEGMRYIERLMAEQYDFLQSVYDFHTHNVILPFPMPQWLQDKFLESMQDMVKNKFFDDLPTAIGIPDNSEIMMKEIQIREQKARDAMILDEKDRIKAKNMIAEKGDDLLIRRNLSEKDEALIKKINYLSDTIKIVKPKEPVPDFSEVYNPEEMRLRDNKARIEYMDAEELYLENLAKVFYLNSADPSTFDLEFWAEKLNITPQRLKNIFYNYSLLLASEGKLIGKISFLEVPKKKEIFDAYQESLKRELKNEQKIFK
ncbi:hypothetical protein SteCoe_28492 [Stentor coeruleus]|uniref:Uncharacterized protein n=1 Tax=Stentor coeruleus TaxID=5963 RepID=A0A1R2B887_9CILI|nr:hypothetical protein SteCoe_28492 [Stentor coeruleus]